jgi:hypothetical protein
MGITNTNRDLGSIFHIVFALTRTGQQQIKSFSKFNLNSCHQSHMVVHTYNASTWAVETSLGYIESWKPAWAI